MLATARIISMIGGVASSLRRVMLAIAPIANQIAEIENKILQIAS